MYKLSNQPCVNESEQNESEQNERAIAEKKLFDYIMNSALSETNITEIPSELMFPGFE